MEELYYIGLDIHKKTISYCTKTKDGTIIARGKIDATRKALSEWALQIQHHYCPVRSRIESAGWGDRVSFHGSLMAARPVKWAFSQIG